MAHGFNVVAFWVNDEGAIVVRVIVWAETWSTIVFSSGGDCGKVKSIHVRTSFCAPRQVTASSRYRAPVWRGAIDEPHIESFAIRLRGVRAGKPQHIRAVVAFEG